MSTLGHSHPLRDVENREEASKTSMCMKLLILDMQYLYGMICSLDDELPLLVPLFLARLN